MAPVHRRNLWSAPARRQGRASAAARFALCAALMACSPAADAPAVEDPPLPPAPAAGPPAADAVPGADRPERIQGTISLEGMEEPMTYRLVRSPEGFPLPFSTYLPEDMQPAAGAGEASNEVRWVAAFGGTPNPEAYVRVLAPAEELDAASAAALARSTAEELGTVEPGDPAGSAVESYRVRGEGTVGQVALERHDGRYFLVVVRYPQEFGDGFGPRVDRILEQWRWADGTPLGG